MESRIKAFRGFNRIQVLEHPQFAIKPGGCDNFLDPAVVAFYVRTVLRPLLGGVRSPGGGNRVLHLRFTTFRFTPSREVNAMRIPVGVCALVALVVLVGNGVGLHAAPLITSVIDHGTAPNAPDTNTPFATSATSPSASGTSAALTDEAFAYSTRTHEWTAAVVDNTTGLLSTTTGNTNGAPVATQTVEPFPSYLKNLEYVQFANNNRNITDYSSDMTFSAPVTAFLFVDNRAGQASGTKANTTDPDLTTVLSWITTDGWSRVNTGFMPLTAAGAPQADYIGIDEGATVANEAARVHTGAGNVAGSGFGVNNFAAIYKKNFPAGLNVGVTKATANSGLDFYGVAVAPQTVPEPSTLVLAAMGVFGGLFLTRRRGV